MKKQLFVGKSLEEALAKASSAFQTTPHLISYNLIEQEEKGFFSKLFSRIIQIEAWVEDSSRGLQAAAREAVMQVLGKNSRVHSILKDFSHLFLSSYGVAPENYVIESQEHKVRIIVKDIGFCQVLQRNPRLSFAFNHVLKRLIYKQIGEYSEFFVCLEVDEALALEEPTEEEKITAFAKRLGKQVLRSGRSVALSSKSNQERRIIHMTLKKYPGISTQSVGQGDERKLVIYPSSLSLNRALNQIKDVYATYPRSKL
jgi:spoIIIJ-associated protein